MTATQNLCNIALGGEFGIFTAHEMREQLMAALGEADQVEVDLAQVTDIDSAGLQLMIAAKREAAARAKTLRFVGHSPAVLDALDLLRLTAYLGDPVLLPGPAEA